MLLPGNRLGQIELAVRFAASPVPVREALKLLTSEGNVDHDPNRRFSVARLSATEARQLFSMRHLLEDDLFQSTEWPHPYLLADLRARAAELEDLLISNSAANGGRSTANSTRRSSIFGRTR
ncbi:MAG: GntR family transcriptional regulator [Sphingomonas sp.]